MLLKGVFPGKLGLALDVLEFGQLDCDEDVVDGEEDEAEDRLILLVADARGARHYLLVHHQEYLIVDALDAVVVVELEVTLGLHGGDAVHYGVGVVEEVGLDLFPAFECTLTAFLF